MYAEKADLLANKKNKLRELHFFGVFHFIFCIQSCWQNETYFGW